MARSFDAFGVRVEDPADLDDAIEAALAAGKPAIVEVMTREQPLAEDFLRACLGWIPGLSSLVCDPYTRHTTKTMCGVRT